ncbi:hypothetical protein S7711_09957, partial [Stachybotrys chartarum IBT 7711]
MADQAKVERVARQIARFDKSEHQQRSNITKEDWLRIQKLGVDHDERVNNEAEYLKPWYTKDGAFLKDLEDWRKSVPISEASEESDGGENGSDLSFKSQQSETALSQDPRGRPEEQNTPFQTPAHQPQSEQPPVSNTSGLARYFSLFSGDKNPAQSEERPPPETDIHTSSIQDKDPGTPPNPPKEVPTMQDKDSIGALPETPRGSNPAQSEERPPPEKDIPTSFIQDKALGAPPEPPRGLNPTESPPLEKEVPTSSIQEKDPPGALPEPPRGRYPTRSEPPRGRDTMHSEERQLTKEDVLTRQANVETIDPFLKDESFSHPETPVNTSKPAGRARQPYVETPTSDSPESSRDGDTAREKRKAFPNIPILPSRKAAVAGGNGGGGDSSQAFNLNDQGENRNEHDRGDGGGEGSGKVANPGGNVNDLEWENAVNPELWEKDHPPGQKGKMERPPWLDRGFDCSIDTVPAPSKFPYLWHWVHDNDGILRMALFRGKTRKNSLAFSIPGPNGSRMTILSASRLPDLENTFHLYDKRLETVPYGTKSFLARIDIGQTPPHEVAFSKARGTSSNGETCLIWVDDRFQEHWFSLSDVQRECGKNKTDSVLAAKFPRPSSAISNSLPPGIPDLGKQRKVDDREKALAREQDAAAGKEQPDPRHTSVPPQPIETVLAKQPTRFAPATGQHRLAPVLPTPLRQQEYLAPQYPPPENPQQRMYQLQGMYRPQEPYSHQGMYQPQGIYPPQEPYSQQGMFQQGTYPPPEPYSQQGILQPLRPPPQGMYQQGFYSQ